MCLFAKRIIRHFYLWFVSIHWRMLHLLNTNTPFSLFFHMPFHYGYWLSSNETVGCNVHLEDRTFRDGGWFMRNEWYDTYPIWLRFCTRIRKWMGKYKRAMNGRQMELTVVETLKQQGVPAGGTRPQQKRVINNVKHSKSQAHTGGIHFSRKAFVCLFFFRVRGKGNWCWAIFCFAFSLFAPC